MINIYNINKVINLQHGKFGQTEGRKYGLTLNEKKCEAIQMCTNADITFLSGKKVTRQTKPNIWAA